MTTNTNSQTFDSKSKNAFTHTDILALFGLAMLTAFLFLLKIDTMPLFDPDEPRYASSAIEMVDKGNWIIPHFNGEPRLNKPPLFYWLTAMPLKWLGASESSARLPSVIFGIGGVILIFLWAKKMWGRKNGFLAGMILSVCPLYYSISRLCITDMTLSFFLYLSLYLFYTGYEKGMLSNRVKIAMSFSMSMMFLAKGHMGILIFFMVVCVFLIVMRDIRFLAQFWSRLGLVVFAALTIPWSVAFVINAGLPGTLNLLFNETYGRFVGGYQHPEPFYFYVTFFFIGFFPWSLFAPLAFIFPRKYGWGFAGEKQNAINHSAGNNKNDPEKSRAIFFSVWMIVVLVFFSLSKSKLFSYILPMAPTVPFICLIVFNNIRRRNRREDKKAQFAILTLTLIFSLIVMFCAPTWFSGKYMLLQGRIFLLMFAFCLCMAAPLAAVAFKGIAWGKYTLVITCYIMIVLIGLNLHLFMGDNRSTKALANDALPAGNDYTLLSYRKIPSSLVFYSGKTAQKIENGNIDAVKSFENKGKDVYIFMNKKDYKINKNAFDKFGYHRKGESTADVILIKPAMKTKKLAGLKTFEE